MKKNYAIFFILLSLAFLLKSNKAIGFTPLLIPENYTSDFEVEKSSDNDLNKLLCKEEVKLPFTIAPTQEYTCSYKNWWDGKYTLLKKESDNLSSIN